jgi:hypothetical protein
MDIPLPLEAERYNVHCTRRDVTPLSFRGKTQGCGTQDARCACTVPYRYFGLVDEAQLPRALRALMVEGRERQEGDLMVGDRALARPPGGWGGGGLRHALRIERDVPFWGGAYTYDGSQFAPRGVHPSQTVSWFLCPLIADAGDLGWLFPLDLVLGTVLYTHILHLGFHKVVLRRLECLTHLPTA